MAHGFEMQDDGTSIEVEVTRDSLNTESVFCIVDEFTKSVFLWKGRLSGVRKKFIGAQSANRIRSEVGTHFRVKPLDEGEETPDFFKAINNSSST